MSGMKSPGSVNRDQKLLKAGVLALLVHVVFFIFMTFGLSWKTHPPSGIVVDLWSDLPQPEQKPTKKIKALPPKPVDPPKKIEPVPPKKVEPAPPKKIESVPSKADIELKKEKEKKAKLAKEKKAKEKEAKLAKEKKEKEKKIKEQKIKEQKIKEQKIKEQKIKEQKIKEQKIKEQNDRVAAETERFQKELGEEEERRRLQKLAYAQSAAKRNLMDEYKAKILAKIKSKLVLPPDLPNDPVAEYDITLLPGGEILSVKLRKGSGFRSFDEAVERAIILARPLPLPKDKLLFQNFRNLSVKVHYLE
jgi:colicin import membrane protein